MLKDRSHNGASNFQAEVRIFSFEQIHVTVSVFPNKQVICKQSETAVIEEGLDST